MSREEEDIGCHIHPDEIISLLKWFAKNRPDVEGSMTLCILAFGVFARNYNLYWEDVEGKIKEAFHTDMGVEIETGVRN